MVHLPTETLRYRIADASAQRWHHEERIDPAVAIRLMERLRHDRDVDVRGALATLYPGGRPGWLTDGALWEVLRAALGDGRLTLLRRWRPRASAHVEPRPGADVSSSGTQSQTTETWWETRLVDELGQPLEGVAVSIDVGGPLEVPSDGDGRSRRVTSPRNAGGAEVRDLETARQILASRWNDVRPGTWLGTAPRHTQIAFGPAPRTSVALSPERTHTLVFQPWVLKAELDGFLFDTNKSFLLPAAVESAPGRTSPIARLREWMSPYPSAHALITGHTDATGDPWYNDPLSLERAETFLAYLEADVDAWLAWYATSKPDEKRWGPHEDHQMLEACARHLALPSDQPSVYAYQTARGLDVDGVIGPQTRRSLVTDYMDLQPGHLALPGALEAHGCGESFPRTHKLNVAGLEAVPVTGDDAIQRRVEMFLFAGELGVQPPPQGSVSPADSPEYPEWTRRARAVRGFSVQRTHTLALRCCDAEHQPIARARLYLEDAVLEADDDGVVHVPFHEGEPERTIGWGEDAPTYTGVLHFTFEADDHGVRRKLRNLGFASVEAFQVRFERPITGTTADVAEDVHRWHDHGPPPERGGTENLVSHGASEPHQPEVSPTPGGAPARSTVVPEAGDALVVGVAARDTLPNQPLPLAEASCEVRRVGSSTAEAHTVKTRDSASGGVVFRYEGVSGSYDIRVRRTRGGTAVGYAERFGVAVASPQTEVTLLLEPVPTSAKFVEGGHKWGWDEKTDRDEPWMSIQQGKSDTAILELDPVHSHRYVHLRVKGSTISLKEKMATGSTTTLHIDGLSKGRSHVEAVHDGKVIAKLGVFVAPLVKKSVMLRMVHDSKFKAVDISTTDFRTTLEKTFRQGIVEFSVTRLGPVTCPYDLDGDFMLDCTAWPTDEMKVIFKAAGDKGYDHNLFVMKYPHPLIGGPGGGMMDMNQRYGFSFFIGGTEESDDDREQRVLTAVHEIGHGAFGLVHNKIEPENIMYEFARQGTLTDVGQWEQMHP